MVERSSSVPGPAAAQHLQVSANPARYIGAASAAPTYQYAQVRTLQDLGSSATATPATPSVATPSVFIGNKSFQEPSSSYVPIGTPSTSVCLSGSGSLVVPAAAGGSQPFDFHRLEGIRSVASSVAAPPSMISSITAPAGWSAPSSMTAPPNAGFKGSVNAPAGWIPGSQAAKAPTRMISSGSKGSSVMGHSITSTATPASTMGHSVSALSYSSSPGQASFSSLDARSAKVGDTSYQPSELSSYQNTSSYQAVPRSFQPPVVFASAEPAYAATTFAEQQIVQPVRQPIAPSRERKTTDGLKSVPEVEPAAAPLKDESKARDSAQSQSRKFLGSEDGVKPQRERARSRPRRFSPSGATSPESRARSPVHARSLSPLHTKEGGAMAEQARNRLRRMKSCGASPSRTRPSEPEPGTVAFERHVSARFRGTLCEVKQLEDEHGCGMETACDPPTEPDPEPHVVQRKVVSEWTNTLQQEKYALDAEEIDEKFDVQVVTVATASKEQPCSLRSHSPLGDQKYMELRSRLDAALEDNARALTASLFGVHSVANERSSPPPRTRSFWRQISMPALPSSQMF